MKGRTTYMSEALRRTRQPYTKATSGTSQEPPRWKTCADLTNDYFPMPVGALFVEEAFSEESKDAVGQMVLMMRCLKSEILPFRDDANMIYIKP